jgi:hypothetical protein
VSLESILETKSRQYVVSPHAFTDLINQVFSSLLISERRSAIGPAALQTGLAA